MKKDIKIKIDSLINEFQNKKIAYTSVDLCNHFRNQYPDIKLRMVDISKYIRKRSLDISHEHSYLYNADLITIDSKGSLRLTYLYHHMNFDINNYMSRDQTTKQTL